MRVYERRRAAFDRLAAKQQRVADRLSNFRLTTMLAGLVAAVFLYRAAGRWYGLALGLVTLLVFGYLAYRHRRVQRQLRYAQALVALNEKGSERAAGRWGAFPDAGAEFRDDEHPYASDLDLFGQGSLFQWINSAQTALGRERLAELLKAAPGAPAAIVARQEAVTELAGRLAWRQRFEAEGRVVRTKLEPAAPLVAWAEEYQPRYLAPWFRWGVRVLPAITVATVAAYYLHGAIPWQVPALLAGVQTLLLWVGVKERSRHLALVYRFEPALRTYGRMLELVERPPFGAPWLRERQALLRDSAGRPASAQIHRLSAIAERISNRENAMFLVINILLLWDFQCMVALEAWKRESGRSLGRWLAVLAEYEAVSSLAHIRFENPGWAMPLVVASELGTVAGGLGHPLITRGRVANDFTMQAPATISVITGSNMSGKSTFLRTVGINLVLAYAGAPVCAERFTCSVMQLWTSMRVSDNLEQNISSFYAELLRIKRIVEATRSGQRVCFLLDEIFKGTNSHDRHQGAKALIGQLQKADAYGLISTHDLELGELERESGGRIRNYHFREDYVGDEIRFDYTLRPGVSTTRNALHLMKLVGIDLPK